MSLHPPPGAPDPAPRPWVFALFAVVVVAAHVAGVLFFDPPSVLFSRAPLSGSDYDTHIEQTWRVLEGLLGWGESWVYDVRLLAGHPNGVIFDADNKGWEYFTYALVRAGVPRGLAFNLFIVVAHFAVLPVFYGSARLLGVKRAGALVATALGSGLWLYDSYLHWIWWVGTLAFAFASYFALLPLALFYRYLEDKRLVHAAGCAVALAASHLIHPYTFLVLAVPMAALYLRDRRALARRDHLAVAAIVLATLALNGPWLVASLRQWHYILDSGYFGQASSLQLVADFAGLLLDTSTTGIIPTRTSIRFLCFAAGALTLVHYARARDRRFLLYASAFGFMLPMSYLGGYSKLASQVQPYRFLGPATFLAALLAADAFERLRAYLRAAPPARPLRGLLVVLALLAAKHVLGDVAGFLHPLLPQVPSLLDNNRSPVTATGYPPYSDYRHAPDHPFLWELATFVDAHDNGRGRFLVQTGAVGEQLAWKTEAEILGGFVLRNLEHAHANLFRRRLVREPTREEVRAYLQAYAVEWVILSFVDLWFATMPDLFELHAEMPNALILRTKVPISRFQENDGRIVASTNRIAVAGTDPARPVVLRYHFHEQLVCAPGCRIEPSRNPVGGVPFIRVPVPHPASFAIVNGYGR